MTLLDRLKARYFAPIFPGNPHEAAARGLYEAVVAQARQPVFYRDCAVADSVDGRFDLLVLHAWLVMRRLREAPAPAAAVSQTLFDLLFFDMDQSVRVSGVGDLKVGPKVTAMGRAFYGRVEAYDRALAGEAAGGGSAGEDALAEALRRNLYRGAPVPAAAVEAVAAYLRRQIEALAGQPDAALLAGRPAFAAAPEPAGNG
ncbi:cytochrome b pre-mRNA-processing protein 3 [Tistlia consotensis]|uniref:Cytochrome b pre-mRNA-processing protein 3 n=1 Tax=Tistlia consotensis USBA 355 TaxID=560819 RepID=A0A1Y6C4W3_9PROT|nr:ubiquinol-cytochrome C chaperone family protein [Tistlia consotensis]SMF43362.1 cytochrome b pre-mRNA-processing protein 3 [Tistlia consotensis USBA 355]SNR42502.1 cytochrome b pre-mRNA-processing protein 3 [Tistlia consotensis]